MRTDSRTETELVALAGEDLDAFAELVERYRDSIQRQCYSRVRDWQYAEDLAQETFVRAYLKLGQLSDAELFPNWLRKIASNICSEFLRGPARRESATDAVADYAGGVGSSHAAVPLDALPPETRACVELFYHSGLSYAEIAEALHASVASVKGRLRRARAVLRKELADLEPRTRSEFTQRVLDTLEQLSRKDPKEREQAASQLHFALAPDRVEAVVAGLTGSDPLARSYWIRPSRRQRSPRVRDALMHMLLHDEWEENRLKAAGALVSQGDSAAIPYLEQAAEAPENPRDVAAAARSAIKQLQAARPYPDTEPEVLGFRRDVRKAAADPESRSDLLKRLKAALDDPDSGVRNRALKALQELGDRRAVPAIAKLLDDPVDGIREAAAVALGELGGKRAVEGLVDVFERGGGEKPPTTAFIALTRIGDRGALPYIMDAICAGTVFDGLQFAERVAAEADIPLIRNALKRFSERRCPPPWKRAMLLLSNERRSPELLEDMARYPLCLEIAASLAKIGDANAAAVLRDGLLSHPTQRAAEALLECGAAGVEAVREALRHPDPNVRQAACSGIASSGGDVPLRAELEELAHSDPDSSVRLRARVALRRLGLGRENTMGVRGWLHMGTRR